MYRAQDLELGRLVALKVLSAAHGSTPERRQRLLEEARVAASFSHPNIAGIHELALDADPPYAALELIEGESLAEVVRRGPVDPGTVARLAEGIASGLAEIHARGLVHGDLKPANVKLDDKGQPKILDFGLSATAAGRGPSPSAADPCSTALAAPGESGASRRLVPSRGGTPRYLAPERYAGAGADARQDVFALGLMLFELLAGRHPFEANGRVDLDRLLHQPAPALSAFRSDVPASLEAVLRRALEKKPQLRYADGGEVLKALARARSSVPAPSGSLERGALAFRGLAPFDPADRGRFFGRDADVASLLAKLSTPAGRFTVLYGASGSGKTSLLRAAVIPRLWESGCIPIYARSFLDPLESIRREAEARTALPPHDEEPLPQFLQRVATAGEVVVVLDQLEEFFIRRPDPTQWRPLLDFVAACLAPAGGIRILVAIRSDFLHLVASHFAEVAEEPLASTRIHHLRMFDAGAAAAVIRESARLAGFAIEDPLVQQVTADLERDRLVLPCELQIVGQELQARSIRGVAEYRRAGGKEALVHGFLDDVVSSTGQRDAAWRLLLGLVTDAGMRHCIAAQDLAESTHLHRPTLDALLRRFVDARLVREVQDQEPWRYELMHEYLIPRIHEANGQVLSRAQRAKRLLGQYLSAHAVDPSTRIPLSHALLIAREAPADAGVAGRSLVRRSLLHGGARLALALLAAALLVTALLARASIRETWDGRQLRDGHGSAVRKIAFSPDGSRLASAGRDGTVIVWDFARRQRIRAWQAHQTECLTVAWSHDGRWIASGGSGPEVALWDARTYERHAVMNGHGSAVSALAFSPADEALATSAHFVTRGALWRVPGGQLVNWFEGVSATEVGTPLFRRDGIEMSGALCRPGSTGCPRVWPPGAQIFGIDRTPDLSRGLFVDQFGFAVLVDMLRRRELKRERVHNDHGRAAAISPDGRLGATAAEDIVLWDLDRFTKLARFETPAIVWSLAFSLDGRLLVSSHADGSIVVWDVAQRRRTAALDGHAGAATASAFTPDGRLLATAGRDGSVLLWDVGTGAKRSALLGHATAINAVAVSGDGTTLASCDQNGEVKVWDLRSAQLRSSVPALDAAGCVAGGAETRCWRGGALTSTASPRGSAIPCYAAVLSRDARWLVTSWGVREAATGRPLSPLFPESTYVYSLALSPDERRLAVGDTRVKQVSIYDTTSWTVLASAPTGPSVRPAAFSHDGQRLVLGDAEGKITLWSVSPLRELSEVGRQASAVTGLAFRPGDQELVASSADRTITLWSVARNRAPVRIATEGSAVSSIALSGDGLRLGATVGDNVLLYEWKRSLWGRPIGAR